MDYDMVLWLLLQTHNNKIYDTDYVVVWAHASTVSPQVTVCWHALRMLSNNPSSSHHHPSSE